MFFRNLFAGGLAVFFLTNFVFAQDVNDLFKGLGIGASSGTYRWLMNMKDPAGAEQKSKTNFTYSDGQIAFEISFFPEDTSELCGPQYFVVKTLNQTKNPVKTVWSQLKMIKPGGNPLTMALCYGANYYGLRGNPIEDDEIGAGDSIIYNYLPADNVKQYRHEAHYDDDGNWVKEWYEIDGIYFLFADKMYNSLQEIKDDKIIGKEFKLKIVLQIEGKQKAYPFVFQVADIVDLSKK